jgi:hypothetical protein
MKFIFKTSTNQASSHQTIGAVQRAEFYHGKLHGSSEEMATENDCKPGYLRQQQVSVCRAEQEAKQRESVK